MGLFGWRRRREEARVAAEELAAVVRLADEDTTILGEQLSRLGRDTDGVALDDQAREDYQGALDAYEAAKRAVPRLTSATEVSTVVDTLSTGRYLLACVRASLDGRPRPELRTPCFFNPQHGPSVRDVLWTRPGRGTRMVPACAQDAARVDEGRHPEVRKVRVGQTVAPYWEAGDAFAPYHQFSWQAAMLEVGNRPFTQGGFGL